MCTLVNNAYHYLASFVRAGNGEDSNSSQSIEQFLNSDAISQIITTLNAFDRLSVSQTCKRFRKRIDTKKLHTEIEQIIAVAEKAIQQSEKWVKRTTLPCDEECGKYIDLLAIALEEAANSQKDQRQFDSKVFSSSSPDAKRMGFAQLLIRHRIQAIKAKADLLSEPSTNSTRSDGRITIPDRYEQTSLESAQMLTYLDRIKIGSLCKTRQKI
jgi:hypothetical protein